MLPERSNATAMSTPLALMVVVLFVRRGCARATMRKARDNQRSADKKVPARDRRARVSPSTSFSEEYKKAGARPRRPFSHASNGSRSSNNK